jgi:hypothetical protein
MATFPALPASRFRSTMTLALYHSGTVIMVSLLLGRAPG